MSDGHPCTCERPNPIAPSSPLCACGGVIQVTAHVASASRIFEEEMKIRQRLKEAEAKAEALQRHASPAELRIIELLEQIEATLQNPPRDQHAQMIDALGSVEMSNKRVAESLDYVARMLREKR